MVKCVCGRQFKNLTKLRRHIKLQNGDPNHVPDREHEATDKACKRYGKGK